MRRACGLRGADGERGAYAILFAVLVVMLFIIVALVIDVGDARSEVRANASRADLASLAAAQSLSGKPFEACQSAWAYLTASIPELAGGTSPCTPEFPTSCDDTTVSREYEAVGIDPYSITFTYPIPDTHDLLTEGGTRTIQPEFDGVNQCERFAVSISTQKGGLFGGIVGSNGLTAPAVSVSRGFQGPEVSIAVALLLLDPVACDALTTGSQNTKIHVLGNGPAPGFIQVDSNGTLAGSNTPGCGNSNAYTINVNDTPAEGKIQADDSEDGLAAGTINLFAMRQGQVTCIHGSLGNHACEPGDVEQLPQRIIPVPIRAARRATRAPVDHTYNCKSSYPSYYGIPISPCVDAADKDPYVDDLEAVVDPVGTQPAGFRQFTTDPGIVGVGSGVARCKNVATSVFTFPAGNWWIDCPASGPNTFSVSGGNVTFPAGNVIFENGVSVSSGSLVFNTSTDPAINPPTIADHPDNVVGDCDIHVCPTVYSQKTAYVYFRNGGLSDGGSNNTITLLNTSLFIKRGRTNIGATGTTTLIGPLEGPFKNLALWSETIITGPTSQQPRLGGQGAVRAEGVFFLPEANPFNFGGQGSQVIPENAQFIARRMNADGQGTLLMRPDPNRVVEIPVFGWWLIR